MYVSIKNSRCVNTKYLPRISMESAPHNNYLIPLPPQFFGKVKQTKPIRATISPCHRDR